MTIHKEGRLLLVILLVVLTAGNFILFRFNVGMTAINWPIAAFSTFFFLLILQFFRHPIRKVEANDHEVIAPADGKVVVIEDTLEPECLKDHRKQVSIFMSPLNVHVNRMPIAGKVKQFIYHKGKYLVAWHPKSSTENERTTMVIEAPGGMQVLVRQIAGALARRIKWYVQEGERLQQGQEFGFIKFGSRVDVFLPQDAEVLVNIGDKTVGGKTVLARLSPTKDNK